MHSIGLMCKIIMLTAQGLHLTHLNLAELAQDPVLVLQRDILESQT